MKIVINQDFGGFCLTEAAAKIAGAAHLHDTSPLVRTNPALIELVENNPKAAGNPISDLVVVEIPDEATDWIIDEYDGLESVLYVVDGKIKQRC